MNGLALNHLWSYLQGLSLTNSNQRWLAERLIEASTEPASAKVAVHASRHSVRQALTDEQLEQELAAYPPLTDDDFPDLEKADYATFLRNEHGKLTKGLEKWL